MKKVRLTLLETNHSRGLRTKFIIGVTDEWPKLKDCFYMYGPGLEREGIRSVITSPVTEIKVLKDGLLEFKTKNSYYRLETLN